MGDVKETVKGSGSPKKRASLDVNKESKAENVRAELRARSKLKVA